MKTACVIGGGGFLGSHVADELVTGGYVVRIYDQVPSRWLRAGQQMVVGDILDLKALQSAVAGCEVVYNFAALADLNEALDKPLRTVEVNVLGTVNALEASRLAGVQRFVYASTVYVYSREGGFYRCSKQAAESYVEEYQRTYGLDFTILRYGSLYGPRADESNGLYIIVRKALEQGSISYVGDSESVREYIHVEDAARSSVVALGEEFRNQSVVLTGSQPMRVLDLLKMLAEIMGIAGNVDFRDEKYAGHYVRTPYAYLPKLGRRFSPAMHVDLGQGLLQLIDDVRAECVKAGRLAR
ncbi:MAG TPA: NAD(P)-dependent oxidoreductase [Steroidobacteraceae bacterium]|nr:NAD(P)-dependent oxidoreductase [Steroidobacteraceae bacterium]